MTGRARRYVVALLSGALLTLAFPQPDLAPLGWLALAPLIAMVGDQDEGGSLARARHGFALGFVFGLAFFGTLLSWISIVGYVGWVLLTLLQAAYLGMFGAAWGIASRRGTPLTHVLVVALLWVAVEYLRAVTPVIGFTWGQLAQSQHNAAWLLRTAAIGGGWLLAAVVAAANGFVAEAWRSWFGARRTLAAGLLGGAVVLIAAPALLAAPDATGERLRVAIVQGDVPRDFPGSLLEKELAIIASHEELTEEIASSQPDLVIWPESSVGIDPLRNPVAGAAIADAAQAAASPMIVGGNLDVGSDRYQVVALEVSPRGEIVDRYQKTHLVPFGEYVPARAALQWIPLLDQIPRDAVPGTEEVIFEVAGGEVAPVISFEGDFGSLVRRRIDLGGRLLVVATNTSTWGFSWASAQHVAFSQVRAAENGVWVAHAALSGISAFIAPDGSVVEQTPLFRATAAVHELSFAEDTTFYARTGDWFPLLSLLIGLGATAYGLSPRPPRRRGRGA